jgi:hypothetical protein
MGKFGNVVLCDVVYTDKDTNKAILAGVYSGDIRVGELPATFPAAIYAEYWPEKSGNISIDLMVFINGAQTGGAKMEVSEVERDAVSMLVVPSYQFAFEKSGTLELRASVDGADPAVILTKKLQLIRPTSTASSPPSSQSPSATRVKVPRP